MEWVVQILLWGAILAYIAFVVRRRIRKIKKGEYCDCCDGSCNCGCSKPAREEKTKS